MTRTRWYAPRSPVRSACARTISSGTGPSTDTIRRWNAAAHGARNPGGSTWTHSRRCASRSWARAELLHRPGVMTATARSEVGVDALELFVEVLSQSEDAAGEQFFDRLCGAVCRLAHMRRALIFRYDSARRSVRAVGAHGLSLEQFADAHVTVESAPIAAQSLREDSVIEVSGDMA